MSKRTSGHANHAGQIIPGTPFLITPSDTETFKDASGRPTYARGISFAAAGALSVVTLDGDTVVIPSDSLAAGIIHPLACIRVNSTSTTATGIVGYC